MTHEEGRSPAADAPETHTHFITEYLALLLRWKRLAVLLFAAILVVAFIEALVLPPVYESQTRLLSVGESGLMANTRLGNLSEFAALIDYTAWGGGGGTGTILSILDSDLLRGRVAADLDLVSYFGIENPDSLLAVNLAARRLRSRISTSISKWDAIIIEAEGNDPDFPIDVLRSVIVQLRAVQNEMSLTTAKRTRQFVETRMIEAEQAYTDAQEALTAFQNEHGMIVVDEQQRALVRLAAELETQLTLKRAELSAARTFFSGEYGRVRQLEAEIEALESELASLQGPGGAADSEDAANFPGRPSLGDLPNLAAQYVRLAMDVEIQQRLLTLLAEQYEQSKISEVREITSFEVVDPPRIPPRATRTRRGIVLAGAIIGILAALIVPLLLESLSRYFPEEARRDAGQLLRRLVTNWRLR